MGQGVARKTEKSQELQEEGIPQRAVMGMVGSRCTVHCYLQGVYTKALWDTGAQVSIVPPSWMQRNLSDVQLRAIEELIRPCEQANSIERLDGVTFQFD